VPRSIADLLRDTAELAARDAERSNRRRDPQQPPVVPLFDADDVDRTLERIRTLRYDERTKVFPGLDVCARDAGHTRGSSSLESLVHGRCARTQNRLQWRPPANTTRRSCKTRIVSKRPI
jgi:hypothetical protein